MPIARGGTSAAPSAAMPTTAVQNTPPGSGPSPIAPPQARNGDASSTGLSVKDILILRQAVMKSVLEAPLMASLAATRQDNEIKPMLKEYVEWAEEWVIRGIQNGVTVPF